MPVEFVQLPDGIAAQDQGAPSVGIEFVSLGSTGAVGGVTAYFKMRGRDQTCPTGQQPAYVYWVVEDAPDETAAFASVGDLICGTDPSTDIVEIEVAHRWQE